MERRTDLTPTRSSMYLSAVHNISASKLTPSVDSNVLKEYEQLKAQVKELELQGRQLSSEAERLAYENNRHSNQYMQKMSY